MSGKVEPTLPALAISIDELDSQGKKVDDLQQPDRASLSSPDNGEEKPPDEASSGKTPIPITERTCKDFACRRD